MGNIGFDPDRIKQEPEGQEVYGMLKKAYQKEMSRTWKERHAKGVPVKMSQFQFYNLIRELPDGDSTEWVRLKNGYPESGQSKDGVEIVFCNFRYKPEWLEKKKRIVCSDEPPPTQHRGGVTEW